MFDGITKRFNSYLNRQNWLEKIFPIHFYSFLRLKYTYQRNYIKHSLSKKKP